MRNKWLIIVGTGILAVAIATAALATSPIKLLVNGGEIRPDVPPQLINGRTMVPVRWVAKALGAQVEWDGQNQVVQVKTRGTGTSDVWGDQVEATDLEIRDAVAVVSRYLASLMSPSGESLEELATSKALDTSQPDRILQPFMLTGESKIVRFAILDVRKTDSGVEVAARRYEAGALSDDPVTYVDEVYTVVREERTGAGGVSRMVPLIDGATAIGSGSLPRDLVW